jgi:hypothetical protein
MVRFVPKEQSDNASVVRTSAFNVGDDILFIGRNDLEAGTLEVTVLGYTPVSTYNLYVELVTEQRELRPMAAIALGQVFHQFHLTSLFPPLSLPSVCVCVCGFSMCV